jgi:hypothetical protein
VPGVDAEDTWELHDKACRLILNSLF